MNKKRIIYKLLICLLISSTPSLATQDGKKNILVMGDEDIGKSTLIKRLNGDILKLKDEKEGEKFHRSTLVIDPDKEGEISKIHDVSFIEIETYLRSNLEEKYKLYKELSEIKVPIHGIILVCSSDILKSSYLSNFVTQIMHPFSMSWKEMSLRTCSVITKIDKMPSKNEDLEKYNDSSLKIYTSNSQVERTYKMIPFDPLNILSEDGDEEGIEKLQQVIDGWDKSINIKDILAPQKDPAEDARKEMNELFATEIEKDSKQVEKLLEKAARTSNETDRGTLARTFSHACAKILSKTIPALRRQFDSKLSKIRYLPFMDKKNIGLNYETQLKSVVNNKKVYIERQLSERYNQGWRRINKQAIRESEEEEVYRDMISKRYSQDIGYSSNEMKKSSLWAPGNGMNRVISGLSGTLLVVIYLSIYRMQKKSKGKEKKN